MNTLVSASCELLASISQLCGDILRFVNASLEMGHLVQHETRKDSENSLENGSPDGNLGNIGDRHHVERLDQFVNHHTDVLSVVEEVALGSESVSSLPSLHNVAIQKPVFSHSGSKGSEIFETLRETRKSSNILINIFFALISSSRNQLDGLSDIDESVSNAVGCTLLQVSEGLLDESNDIFRLHAAVDDVGHLLLKEAPGNAADS